VGAVPDNAHYPKPILKTLTNKVQYNSLCGRGGGGGGPLFTKGHRNLPNQIFEFVKGSAPCMGSTLQNNEIEDNV